jgi:HEAT repeat protein
VTTHETPDYHEEAVQLSAIQALGGNTGPEAVQQLVRALGAKSWRVRQAAVAALAHDSESGVIGAVLRAMREKHRDLSVLNGAIQV